MCLCILKWYISISVIFVHIHEALMNVSLFFFQVLHKEIVFCLELYGEKNSCESKVSSNSFIDNM